MGTVLFTTILAICGVGLYWSVKGFIAIYKVTRDLPRPQKILVATTAAGALVLVPLFAGVHPPGKTRRGQAEYSAEIQNQLLHEGAVGTVRTAPTTSLLPPTEEQVERVRDLLAKQGYEVQPLSSFGAGERLTAEVAGEGEGVTLEPTEEGEHVTVEPVEEDGRTESTASTRSNARGATDVMTGVFLER